MRPCCLIFLLLLPSLIAAQEYSLPLLQQLALEHNETLQIQERAVRQSRQAVERAGAQRLPKLDFSSSYQHFSKVGSIDFAVPGFIERSIRFGDGNIYDLGLRASVPVFAGFRLATAVDREKTQELIARVSLEGGKADVQNQVAALFNGARLALSARQILTNQQVALRKSLGVRKAQLKEGQTLPLDTLIIAIRLKQLEVDAASASQQYAASLHRISLLTGLNEPFDLRVAPDVPGPKLDKSDIASLMEKALANRSDLRQLSLAKDASLLGVTAARSAYFPTVAAAASYRYGRPGVDQVKNEWMDYYTVGVMFEWNLWSWGGDARAVESAQLETEKAHLRESQLRSSIRTRLATLLDELAVLRQTFVLLSDQVRLEEEKFKLVEVRFNQGLATGQDMVDAEISLTNAILRLDQTRIHITMKDIELSTETGQVFTTE